MKEKDNLYSNLIDASRLSYLWGVLSNHCRRQSEESTIQIKGCVPSYLVN